MSSNPFSRNNGVAPHEARLGHFIGPDAVVNMRDAVHIAVAPVVAGCELQVGSRVAILSDGITAVSAGDNGDDSDEAVGIVDPFLPGWSVPEGTKFWLFLFQGSVTTLRHEWTHPAFPAPSAQTSTTKTTEQEAEFWLRKYASKVNPYYGPEQAFRTLIEDLRQGAITYHGTDMHGREDLIDADNLQRYASIYLKQPVDFSTFEYFSCTC